MAEEGLQIVELQDFFYRDNFGKVVLLMASLSVAIVLLGAISFYLHFSKPKPVTFSVYPEWRVVGPVAEDQPYITVPDLMQWTNDAIRSIFVFDFNNYNEQLNSYKHYFTPDGWNVYLNQLNNYASNSQVAIDKLFITSAPDGAPIILNQGLLSGRYGWWVQVPITLQYQGAKRSYSQSLTLQILIVRVPTTSNLSGVAIDNMMVNTGTGKV